MLEPLSLETPIGEGEDSLLGDLLTNIQDLSPADEALARMLKASLAETLSGLSPREQIVLRHRFGLDDVDIMTLAELGEQLGVTRERVRQIEQKALCMSCAKIFTHLCAKEFIHPRHAGLVDLTLARSPSQVHHDRA
jgi:DNA-directed RNA polymerase sigma subunit (sigma70/sigma32)